MIFPMLAPNVDLNLMIKTGAWLLSELKNIPKNGKTVFSCFHCGGGSTMGYKGLNAKKLTSAYYGK